MKHLLNILCIVLAFNATAQTSNVIKDLNGPSGIVIHNDNLYIAEWNAGKISKMNLKNKSESATDFLVGLTKPSDMILYKNHLYFSEQDVHRISRIDLSKTNPTREDVITSGINNPSSLMLYKDKIYFREENGKVSKINLLESQPKVHQVVDGLKSLFGGIIIIDNSLYIAETQLNKILKVDLSDTTKALKEAYSGLNGPIAFAASGSHLYVTNAFEGSVLKFNLKNQEEPKVAIASGLGFPIELYIFNDELFIVEHTPVPGGKIEKLNLKD